MIQKYNVQIKSKLFTPGAQSFISQGFRLSLTQFRPGFWIVASVSLNPGLPRGNLNKMQKT